MKAVVFSLGCKVNECERDSLISGLESLGYSVTDKLEFADLYIVNTCAVTKEAEKKSRQTMARIKKINSKAKIVFTGCACQKDGNAFYNKDKSVLVTGTFNKGKILDLLDESGVKICKEDDVFEELFPVKTTKSRAFIKVQDGCDNFCAYCIIPYLRGRSRSRSIESIKNEILQTAKGEAVLTGINLSSYNYNGKGLSDLIKSISDLDVRIRLGSLEVRVIDDEFLSACKALKNFAPHFHLSLQSGSDSVLKKMNRHYTREEFISKCELIRKYFPTAGITTDIIAGFPTETEEDFLLTLDLIDQVKFSDIHPFIFSPREGTVAYKMNDIIYSVKKERLDRLLEKKKICKSNFSKLLAGKTEEFLFEYNKDGYAEGYTGNYLRVYVKDFNGSGLNKIVVKGEYLDGAIAEII